MKRKLYGEIFSKKRPKEVDNFNASIDIDKKLLIYDIKGSIAHAKMLGRKNIISSKDATILVKGLNILLLKAIKGKLGKPDKKFDEDVHTYITNLLKKEIQEKIADKLHAARSRNDQVCLDTRMYCKEMIDKIISFITSLEKSIYKKAKENKNVVMPVYTHLQPAQAILVSHLLCAYLEELEKDKTRFKNAKENVDFMSLGSCATRGTAYPIDRELVAKILKFSKISQNSIEAISNRDFILELLSAIVILSINLSRIAEDLIIFSTYEFDFIEIDERYLTSSSMMPNKRNADTLELIRGFAAKALGAFTEVASAIKNLPHAYNRDMQYDKEALFRSIGGILSCLEILEGVFKTLKVKKDVLNKYLKKNDLIFATDIAEFLGIKKGLSYREAHNATAKIIKFCLQKEKRLQEVKDEDLKKLELNKLLNEKIIKKLTDPVESVKSIKSEGGTSPKSVAKQLNYWKKILK
jgi:argininosuccinate lyase